MPYLSLRREAFAWRSSSPPSSDRAAYASMQYGTWSRCFAWCGTSPTPRCRICGTSGLLKDSDGKRVKVELSLYGAFKDGGLIILFFFLSCIDKGIRTRRMSMSFLETQHGIILLYILYKQHLDYRTMYRQKYVGFAKSVKWSVLFKTKWKEKNNE